MTLSAEAVQHRLAQLAPATPAAEDWRYVDVRQLSADAGTPRPVALDELRALVPPGMRALVAVDGRFHSIAHGDWPAAWRLAWSEADAITNALATYDDPTAVAGLAAAGWRQDLEITGNHDEPLHIWSVTTGGSSSWRLAIRVTPGASATVHLHHHALGGRSTVLIDAELARGARLTVCEQDAPRGNAPRPGILVHAHARVAQDAALHWTAVGGGSALSRWRLDASLDGPGADADIATLDRIAGDDQAHRLTRVIHTVGPTTSRQVIKTIAGGHGRASFDGIVRVRPGADGTDASQQNRNLLLSPHARADTRPQLDIKADAVKAAHGATVGRLAADEELYLRSRGLAPDAARELLITAFAAEVTGRIK